MNPPPDDWMLKAYTKYTQATILSDEEINAWADFFQCEPELRNRYWFDIFIGDPKRFCREIGMLPRQHYGAVGGGEFRHLLPRQRFVAGRIK